MKSTRELSEMQVWAGSEESHREYLQAKTKWEAATPEAAGIVLSSGLKAADKDEVKSRLLTVAHGVGIITIAGKLVSEDSWWNKYAGLVSYNEIRAAALEALAHPGVKEVLLDISSPGGHVSGILDAVESLNALGKVKKITGYTDSVANSGGFWLFSTASKRLASPVASIGSIGVIMVHMEYTKAMAEAGVTPTVFRAGKYKALGGPYEKLSELAKTEINESMDHVYGVFVQSIADNLNTTYQAVESKMAQGRVFIGSQAVEAGLVDSVSNFDKVYATMVNRVAKGDKGMRTTQGALQAAAAAGALTAEELEAAKKVGTEEATPEIKDDKDLQVAEGDTPDAEGDNPKVEGEAATKGEGDNEGPSVDGGSAMDLLKSQLAEASDALVDLKVELKEAQATAAKLQATVDPLKAVVASATNNMTIALGHSANDKLAESSVEDVLSAHTKVSEQFAEQFKVGGVGSPAAEVEDNQPKVELSSVEKARLKSAKVVPMTR